MEVIGMKVKGSWRDVDEVEASDAACPAFADSQACLQLEMDRHSLLGVGAFRPSQVRRRTLGQHAADGSHRHDNPVSREEMPQGALVTHTMLINAQALIAVSKKRLCNLAAQETRYVWHAVCAEMFKVDAEMAWAMRPECDWCGGYCPEMKGCGARPYLGRVFG